MFAFSFPGSRIASWLPSFSVEVMHTTSILGIAQASNSQLNAMVIPITILHAALFIHLYVTTSVCAALESKCKKKSPSSKEHKNKTSSVWCWSQRKEEKKVTRDENEQVQLHVLQTHFHWEWRTKCLVKDIVEEVSFEERFEKRSTHCFKHTLSILINCD